MPPGCVYPVASAGKAMYTPRPTRGKPRNAATNKAYACGSVNSTSAAVSPTPSRTIANGQNRPSIARAYFFTQAIPRALCRNPARGSPSPRRIVTPEHLRQRVDQLAHGAARGAASISGGSRFFPSLAARFTPSRPRSTAAFSRFAFRARNFATCSRSTVGSRTKVSMRLLVGLGEGIDADDQLSLGVHIALIRERGVGDLAAEKARFDGRDHATHSFDAVEILLALRPASACVSVSTK